MCDLFHEKIHGSFWNTEAFWFKHMQMLFMLRITKKKKKEGEIDKELEPKLRKVEFQDVWKYDLSDSLAIRPFIYYFHSPPPLAEHFEKMRKDGKIFGTMLVCVLTERTKGEKTKKINPARGKQTKYQMVARM